MLIAQRMANAQPDLHQHTTNCHTNMWNGLFGNCWDVHTHVAGQGGAGEANFVMFTHALVTYFCAESRNFSRLGSAE